MFRYIFFAAFLTGFTTVHAENGICVDGKKHYRTTLRHIEGGGIGYKDGYTTLEAFLASDPSKWVVTPFLDMRGHLFNNGKWVTNIGSGLRSLLKNRVYGINAYYDYRNGGRLHANQIGVGLETLGEVIDFRINGYLPVGSKISDPYGSKFGAFSSNYMLLSQKYQSAMKGSDAEFGFHFGKPGLFDFYAAAGPYYFIGKKAPVTWGGKARIAGTFKETLTLEISDSYDRTFHNKFQGQISLTFLFGPKSKIKEKRNNCKVPNTLNDRMLQPVGRQEIIVMDSVRRDNVAIDPSTDLPYNFVFVDNTSSSEGTYESPYHSLIQAQENSSPNDIIYVFPGDGTTRGMDSGITLKENLKFWGSGVSHKIQTSQGMISIPALSASLPTITNMNIDTDRNAITVVSNNAISGFNITSAGNDAIYGADSQNLDVSFCTITGTNTYPIAATSLGESIISISNNQFLDNVDGIILTLNGTSTVSCLNNVFKNQTSEVSVPIHIVTSNNTSSIYITNNIFDNNTTGSIRFTLNQVLSLSTAIYGNAFTNNGDGNVTSLGSNIFMISSGTNDFCSIALENNTFSGNASNSLYLYYEGAFRALEAEITGNTMSNNGGFGLVFGTPVDSFTFVASNNSITGTLNDGIAFLNIVDSLTRTGSITINNNTISDLGAYANGISISQNFTDLNLAIVNNRIDNCAGTGIFTYPQTKIESLTMNISDNIITNCQNAGSNDSSGINIQRYRTLRGSVINNTLTDNNLPKVVTIDSGLVSPRTCITLTGNSSSNYYLTNPEGGLFNLSPCNVDAVNVGVIYTSDSINLVQSCSNPTPCAP
jgi:hypothetical protein